MFCYEWGKFFEISCFGKCFPICLSRYSGISVVFFLVLYSLLSQFGNIKCRFLRGSSANIAGHPWICIAAQCRGKGLVVSASLVDASSSSPSEAAKTLLAQNLEAHPELEVGHLQNGLRYVILPNSTPPNRFEAHLEVHAGSVHEEENEQGIAHLVEHVTFLGSKKREQLLGTGARSNAYTDFHHTVFHVHAPHANGYTGEPMLPQVLDALAEIAFEPEFLPSRIEKERKAIVAEAQMMNTIEYRVDCQLLQYLHWENALSRRFPIGKMEQVDKWQRDEIQNFWQRNYFPSNATLYVVGDIDTDSTRELIRSTFERIPASSLQPDPAVVELDAEIIEGSGIISKSGNKIEEETNVDSVANGGGAGSVRGALLDNVKQTNVAGLTRPPVQHQWGCGPLVHSLRPAPISIFRHRLLQYFQLSLFCKIPIRSMTTMEDLRRAFMVRVVLSVMQFRVNARYVAQDPPFVGIEFDHSDSGREGCAVSTLTITSEPKDWRGAIQVAIEEVRRLQKYGVTAGELKRYKDALLRDSELLAEGAESVPSSDTLEFVMESLALGHTVLDQKDAHKALLACADTITVEEVNAICRSLLSYMSHFRRESTLLEEYDSNPALWADPGPTVATSVVACVPAFMDASGHGMGGAAPMGRGASLATTQHVDPAATSMNADDDSSEEGKPPEGAVRFELTADDIEQALKEEGFDVEPLPDVDVPEALVPDHKAAELIEARKPHFVSLTGENNINDASGLAPADPETGILLRRLSNGIRVNFRHTSNEPRAAMVRLVAAGGRALEEKGMVGPRGHGSVAVGTRALSESGTVGEWEREQVELFCISRLINCILEANEEFICMDFHFAVADGGLGAALQLLHLFLENPRWEPAAMDRAKQLYLNHWRALEKSLERATPDRIMAAMTGVDRRFRDPNADEISALTLEGMKSIVMEQLHAGNLEISIVGDLEESEVEDAVLRYLGTVSPRPDAKPILGGRNAIPELPELLSPSEKERHSVWHLQDSDERACAFVAGPAPPRWGDLHADAIQQNKGAIPPPPPALPPNAPPEALAAAAAARRKHPLYPSVALGLLTEIINGRLFTTVRDTLGLTYDVSFELSLFDRLPAGWFTVNVTSTPEKIKDAALASIRVLRSGETQPFTERDLLRAKRTLLTRHESDLKDNAYWLSLLTHLQSDAVPLKRIECLRDLRAMYESMTVEDIYDAYAQFDFSDNAIYTCVATSGPEPVLSISPVLEEAERTAIRQANLNLNGKDSDTSVPAGVDPEAFMAALRAFMGSVQTGQDQSNNDTQK